MVDLWRHKCSWDIGGLCTNSACFHRLHFLLRGQVYLHIFFIGLFTYNLVVTQCHLHEASQNHTVNLSMNKLQWWLTVSPGCWWTTWLPENQSKCGIQNMKKKLESALCRDAYLRRLERQSCSCEVSRKYRFTFSFYSPLFKCGWIFRRRLFSVKSATLQHNFWSACKSTVHFYSAFLHAFW